VTYDAVRELLKTGAIKVKPDSWKDTFFPNAHNLAGT